MRTTDHERRRHTGGLALVEGREAGIAIPLGLALLVILVWAAVLGSSPLVLVILVAVAGIAALTAAAL
ncbi:hypothetical protein [Rhodococcus opacus]|uniref:Uncharacterized protein n=1 Tax=Rhodococcus opacus (strain B4) TaxID=632772 RepID=C1ASH5_RHOOB|nr:hypothetical protein [Rhodococcus opacus]BAH48424.1 hypothetical protein ROP_01770 [Rhodococcus opacus B4]